MDHNMYLHSWAALFVASVVGLTSLLSEFDDNVDWSKEQKWAVSVTSVSLGLAFFSFFFRLTKQEMFTGTLWEHGTVSYKYTKLSAMKECDCFSDCYSNVFHVRCIYDAGPSSSGHAGSDLLGCRSSQPS